MVVGVSIQGPDLANALACMNSQCDPETSNGLRTLFGNTNSLFHPCKHANGTDIDRSRQFMCRNESRTAARVSVATDALIDQVAALPEVAGVPGVVGALQALDLEDHARLTSVTPNQIATTLVTTIEDVKQEPVSPDTVEDIARIVAFEFGFIPVGHQHHRPDTGEAGVSPYDPQNPLTWKPYQIKRKEQPLPRQILTKVGSRTADFSVVGPIAERVQGIEPAMANQAKEIFTNPGIIIVIVLIIALILANVASSMRPKIVQPSLPRYGSRLPLIPE
jgi:hypothetical protein